MPVGYVYILSNQAYPGLLKIGYTTHDVVARAAELSAATGVAGPFEVEYWHLTAEAEDVEREVHEHFKAVRVNQKREFFRVEIDYAIEQLERRIKAPLVSFRKTPPARTPEVLHSCTRCGHRYAKDHFVNMFCPKCGLR